jgi:hypothetical protein
MPTCTLACLALHFIPRLGVSGAEAIAPVQASMSDLERHYDEQASKLRSAFVAEVAQLYSLAGP